MPPASRQRGFTMRYRPLGRSGVMVSELSFGCGRLPGDDEEAARVIHAAINAGCNYYETATFYCEGRCQEKTALGVRGYTDRVMVSPKQGVLPDTTAYSYRTELDRQFRVLGVDAVEWLMVGWLTLEALPMLTKKDGALEAIEQARGEGIIRHIGFTGHDTPENFIAILKTGLFESMTVTYNLLNRSYEPAIAKAHELGVGVVVMNPVGGGVLGEPSPELQQLIPGVTSTAALALRFVLANPGVSTACSGMASIDMVAENVATVTAAPTLTEAEREQFYAVIRQFEALGERFCTGCRYCMPCPHGVDIPTCFRQYNLDAVYGLKAFARNAYLGLQEAQRASACVRCGECESRCPNHLPIMEQLESVRDLFETVASAT